MIAILVFFLVLAYLLPAVIAFIRERRQNLVLIINFFFGWTVIGWCLALVIALWPSGNSALPKI